MCSPSETTDIPSVVGHAESLADHPWPVHGDRPPPAAQTVHFMGEARNAILRGASSRLSSDQNARSGRAVSVPKAPPQRAASAPPEVGVLLAGGSVGPGAPPEVGVLLAGGAASAGAAVRARTSSERPDTATATRSDSCQESAKFGPQMKARDGDIVEIVVTPP